MFGFGNKQNVSHCPVTKYVVTIHLQATCASCPSHFFWRLIVFVTSFRHGRHRVRGPTSALVLDPQPGTRQARSPPVPARPRQWRRRLRWRPASARSARCGWRIRSCGRSPRNRRFPVAAAETARGRAGPGRRPGETTAARRAATTSWSAVAATLLPRRREGRQRRATRFHRDVPLRPVARFSRAVQTKANSS